MAERVAIAIGNTKSVELTREEATQLIKDIESAFGLTTPPAGDVYTATVPYSHLYSPQWIHGDNVTYTTDGTVGTVLPVTEWGTPITEYNK